MNDLNDLSKILEDFNRALESTTKAIAEKSELIVSFNQDGKDTNDETIYLPQITKKFIIFISQKALQQKKYIILLSSFE